MFTIKVCLRDNEETGERVSYTYAAASYSMIRRFKDKDGKPCGEYVDLSFDFGESCSAEFTIGGPDYPHDNPVAAVYVTNIDGRTIDSWRMHELAEPKAA